MAFGINRKELEAWKKQIEEGQIAFLTHFWLHPRFPNITTVTKVGCSDLDRLLTWGKTHDLQPEWLHHRSSYPHFDLIGNKQKEILSSEGLQAHIERFKI